MSSRITGLERVPNVYIKKIILSAETIDSFKMHVSLQINDSRDASTSKNVFMWSDSEVFKKYFKIAIIATSNNGISNLITNGAIIPLPNNIRKLRQFGSETLIKTLGISDFKRINGAGGRRFTNTCEYTILKSYENLNIFVVPYIDMLEVGTDLNVPIPEKFRAYLGAITSERVFESRRLQKDTVMFLMENNDEIWMGPVHRHGEVYMAGSVHTSAPHSSLRAYSVKNTKLIDRRKKDYNPRNQTQTLADTIIGNLMVSPGTGARMTGIFPINMRQIALKHTKMGNIIGNMSNALLQEYLASIDIRGLYIYRQGVKVGNTRNKVGSRILKPKKVNFSKTIDNISRVYLDASGFIRYYQFSDSSDINDPTDYMYEIKLALVDKSQEFLTNKLRNLETNLSSLQSEISRLNLRTNYNYVSKTLKVSPSSNMDAIISNYYITLSYFMKIDSDSVKQKIRDRRNEFLKGNYTPEYGTTFVADFKKIVSKFRKTFKAEKSQLSNFSKISISNRFAPGFLSFQKTWNSIVKFTDFKHSYDCLGEETSSGLVTMTFDKLNRRGTMEVDRFFDKEKTLHTEGMQNLSIKNQKALKDVSTFKNTFLSPLSFTSGNKTVDITKLGQINDDELTNSFFKAQEDKRAVRKANKGFVHKPKKKNKRPSRKSQRKGSQQRKINKKPFTSAFRVLQINPAMKINKLTAAGPTITSAEYLGANSEFVDGVPNYSEIAPQTDAEIITNNLKSSLRVSTNRNKFDFDLQSDNNFVEQLIKDKPFPTFKLRKAPVQLKALIASRSPAARNNILEAPVDILKNPSTKIATEMTFQATQKIQVLVGYEKNSDGVEMISDPKWVDLGPNMLNNNTTVLCRMVYNEDASLGLKPDESFKMTIKNEFFFVSSENLSKEKFIVLPSPTALTSNSSKNNQISDYIMYASSNIVTQPNSLWTSGGMTNLRPTPASSPVVSPSSPGPSGGGGGGGY